jgi:hypothetical protein
VSVDFIPLDQAHLANNGGEIMRKTEAGQGLIEYALFAVLIAIITQQVIVLLTPALHEAYCTEIIGNILPGGIDPSHPFCGAYADQTPLFVSNTTSVLQDENDADIEKIIDFGEQIRKQEESLDKLLDLMTVGIDDILQTLSEYADENDEVLSDGLDEIIWEVNDGNYDSIEDGFFGLLEELADVPEEVQLIIITEIEPDLILACKTLKGAEIQVEIFDAAMQNLDELEQSAPSSLEDVRTAMNDLWDDAEERNLLIGVAVPIIGSLIDAGIDLLENSGADNLVRRFEAQSMGCGIE